LQTLCSQGVFYSSLAFEQSGIAISVRTSPRTFMVQGSGYLPYAEHHSTKRHL